MILTLDKLTKRYGGRAAVDELDLAMPAAPRITTTAGSISPAGIWRASRRTGATWR